MSRNAGKQGRGRKAGVWGTLVVALLGGAGALLHACRGDWLDELAQPETHESGSDRDKPSTTSTSKTKTNPIEPTKKPLPRPKSGDAKGHLALGTPEDSDTSDDYILRKPQYVLSYNRDQNVANWVSWELNAGWFGSAPRHKGKFLEDQDLPAGFYRVGHDDYTGSGYDRGHMVRSEERTRSPEDNRTTFFMTNILPQYHDLNAGPWLRLEERCEELARRQNKQLYVIAGGILKRGKKPSKTIGKGVTVPDTFFKVVVVMEPGQGADDVNESTEVFAVLMPNDQGISSEGWERYRTSVDEIERRSGYELLSAVPEEIQKILEARKGN